MSRVIKSELKRYFSGKMVYICAGLLMLFTLLDYGMAKILIEISPESNPQIEAMFLNLSSQSFVLNELRNLFTGGNGLIMSLILAASLVSGDYGNGTMKYSLLAVSREKLIIGKVITASIINLIYIIAPLVSASIIGIAGYDWATDGYSYIQILGAASLCWVTLVGFTCLIMFAVNAVGKFAGAIGLGIGIYVFISMLSLLPNKFKSFVISINLYKLADLNLSGSLEVLGIGLLYTVLFAGLLTLVFRRKEMMY